MLLEIRRENTIEETGAIPGRLYVNGNFFAYTLENAAKNIPAGIFGLYDRFSPKFGKRKVYIEVPGRTFILFHGGNVPEHSGGCVLVAANRINESKIQGDQSDILYEVVKTAWDAGENVRLVVYRPLVVFAVCAAAAGLYYLTKN